MHLKHAVETIVTTFLFLSRVWSSRDHDIECEGGRREGDKWFDGCRWCVCQRSGPVCSPAECSELVSQVPPCENLGSRWWDGCYHCKCQRHGIECAAESICVSFMNKEHHNGDLLLHGACINPKDDRCVCGIDGVPSCSAEVIDRSAHLATTIGLEATFPSSSSLVKPRKIYYDSSKNLDKRHSGTFRDEYQSDPSVSEREVFSRFHDGGRHNKHHSLTKRHTSESQRHISNSEKLFRRREPDYDMSSFSKRDSYRSLRRILDQLRMYNSEIESLYFDYLEGSRRRNKRHFDRDDEVSWEDRSYRYKRTHGNNRLRERSRDEWGRQREDGYVGDEPSNGEVSRAPSLLVTSDNRCRWGARWYGGGLRCYCDSDNSITCGDPSFVASRIDGFRLEKSQCEQGHVWEEEDTCRLCECRMSGMALCQRSHSCPLPFLITPVTLDTDGQYYFDREEFDGTGSGRSRPTSATTDEFKGRDGDKNIDWDKAGERRNRVKPDGSGSEIDDVSGGSGSETENRSNGGGGNKMVTSPDRDQVTENDGDSTNGDGSGDVNVYINPDGTKNESPDKPKPTVVDLDFDSTGKPSVVVDSNSDFDNVDQPEKGDDYGSKIDTTVHVGGKGTESDSTGGGETDTGDSGNKRTEVIVQSCVPHSRWMDGCKRCRCSSRGDKHCDDSRCLKAPAAPAGLTRVSFQNGRPVQLPPALPPGYVARTKPVTLDLPYNLEEPCGRFKVGQRYWVKCNMCLCTPQGPKCTAKNCG